MNETKKRKSDAQAGGREDASDDESGAKKSQDTHVVYTNTTGREEEAKEDPEKKLSDFLGQFYIAEINLSQKGYKALEKHESGDVFVIKMANPTGKTFNLVAVTSGDGGWHESRHEIWWTSANMGFDNTSPWCLTTKWETVRGEGSSTKIQTMVGNFLDFAGVTLLSAAAFREIHGHFTKVWIRRAYSICKDLRKKQYAEMQAQEGKEPGAGAANVAAFMTSALDAISGEYLGHLRGT